MTNHDNLVLRQNIVKLATDAINHMDPNKLKVDNLIGVELYVGGGQLDALIHKYIPAYKSGSIYLTAVLRRKNGNLKEAFEMTGMDIYYDNQKITIVVPTGLNENLAMEQCLGDIFQTAVMTDNPFVQFGRVDGQLRPMRKAKR